jgi:hypothetical protein
MRLALIIVHLVFFGSVSLAQHCGFDHEYLLGVRPFSGDSSNVIEGLRITLVDEYQRPLEIQPSPECTQNKTTKLSYLGKPVSHSNHQYWFAPHDYVFVGFQSAWANSRAYVKIEDTKGLNNGHKFETQLIPFSQLNFIHLCGYSPDYEGKKFEKYRPIWVDLQRPPRIIRQDVLEKKPFIFVLDKNPENVHIDEAVGCYAARLSVYASWSNALLFDTLLQGIMNFESCQNIFYARDFNFDGYPDFRICVDGEKNAPYFLYDYPTVSFRQDSLLSSFQHILFDESRKSATGYGKLVPFQGSPYTYSQQIHEMRGEKLSWVKVESHLSGSPNWHAQVQAVDSFYYVDGKRKPFVSTSEGPTTVSITINGWRVERKIEIYFAPETTEIKPLGYQPRKQSAAVYRIYRIFDEKLLLFASGE